MYEFMTVVQVLYVVHSSDFGLVTCCAGLFLQYPSVFLGKCPDNVDLRFHPHLYIIAIHIGSSVSFGAVNNTDEMV